MDIGSSLQFYHTKRENFHGNQQSVTQPFLESSRNATGGVLRDDTKNKGPVVRRPISA